jgi:hypothetical protein
MAKRKNNFDAARVIKLYFPRLVAALQEMTEAQIEKAMELEIKTKNRASYLDRYRMRLTQMRIDKVREGVTEQEEAMQK